MTPTRVSNLDTARRRYGDKRVDFYVEYLMRGDPLGDAVVLAFETLPSGEGQRMLQQALDHGIATVANPPPALGALFEQLDHVPAFVDWRRMRNGARTYRRTGPAGALTLSAVSLMNGYHSHAATKALVFTGQLDQMARRRLGETGRFIVETIQPDGLRRFAQGFKTTVKVRIIHAYVRRFLSRSPAWQTADWGVPINNADMAATNLAFSFAMLYGTRRMGLRFTTQEADDLMLLWSYSGYLSGVDPALLVSTEREADAWANMIYLLQPGPDDGSRLLADALRNVHVQLAGGPLSKLFWTLVTRYHNGLAHAGAQDDIERDLGVPDRIWRHAIPLTRLVITPLELARQALPLGNRAFSWLGNRAWHNAIKTVLAGARAEFHPPPKPAFEHRFARPR